MYARAWALHLYAMQSSRDYACLCMWLCTSTPCSQFVNLHAWACEYACMCLWLFTSMLCRQLDTMYAWAYEYVHLCHAISYANDSLVVSGPLKWLIQQNIPFNRLCTFMLCSQLITMYACACDYAHLIYVVATFLLRSSQLCVHEHVAMHIYAMKSARGYACMCMWLCISMLCSQLVIMNAWACDHAHLCCADSLWLCMHVHVIMHIYAMQRVCHAFSYANDSLVVYGLLSWLI